MRTTICAGDLVVALHAFDRRDAILARPAGGQGLRWTISIPKNTLLLVAAASEMDSMVTVFHNEQLLDVLRDDVKLAEVTR